MTAMPDKNTVRNTSLAFASAALIITVLDSITPQEKADFSIKPQDIKAEELITRKVEQKDSHEECGDFYRNELANILELEDSIAKIQITVTSKSKRRDPVILITSLDGKISFCKDDSSGPDETFITDERGEWFYYIPKGTYKMWAGNNRNEDEHYQLEIEDITCYQRCIEEW